MNKNIGPIDKGIRLALAAGIAVALALGDISGTLFWVLCAAAAALTVTSMISFCGLYTIFGISTCKTSQ